MLLVYNYVLLKMSSWYSKHVEESNNVWRINNIQCITLVVLYGTYRRSYFTIIHPFTSVRCNVTAHKLDCGKILMLKPIWAIFPRKLLVWKQTRNRDGFFMHWHEPVPILLFIRTETVFSWCYINCSVSCMPWTRTQYWGVALCHVEFGRPWRATMFGR